MRKFGNAPNTDGSDLINYPDKRIKDNTGANDGTPINEFTSGDIWQFFLKITRRYGIIPNGLPDNETNGFQMVDGAMALPSKNDFILNLTTAAGVINVPVKIGFMEVGEQIVCKASFDKTTETQIKGSDGVTAGVTFVGDFKTGEYVRLIKNGSAPLITLVRLVDAGNLTTIATEESLLLAATQAEENAGVVDTKGTTPLTNKTVFERRVNGVDSDDYLASKSQNGLLSLEDKEFIDRSAVINKGWVGGVWPGANNPGAILPVDGDIASATVATSAGGTCEITVTLDTAMATSSYYVRMFVKSEGASAGFDAGVGVPIFRITNETTFAIILKEFLTANKSLKIFIETVNY